MIRITETSFVINAEDDDRNNDDGNDHDYDDDIVIERLKYYLRNEGADSDVILDII